jgi:hypothetical protein
MVQPRFMGSREALKFETYPKRPIALAICNEMPAYGYPAGPTRTAILA